MLESVYTAIKDKQRASALPWQPQIGWYL